MKARGPMLLNHEAVARRLLHFAGGLGCFFELAFPFVFFETHQTYNSGMGRFRIKKKEVVIPFRETLAYRMILLTGSIIMFLFALYVLIGAGVIGVVGAFAIFYNLDHLRDARIPKKTLSKMKRR